MAIGDLSFFFLLSIFGFEIIDRSGQEEKVWVKYEIKVNKICIAFSVRGECVVLH